MALSLLAQKAVQNTLPCLQVIASSVHCDRKTTQAVMGIMQFRTFSAQQTTKPVPDAEFSQRCANIMDKLEKTGQQAPKAESPTAEEIVKNSRLVKFLNKAVFVSSVVSGGLLLTASAVYVNEKMVANTEPNLEQRS